MSVWQQATEYLMCSMVVYPQITQIAQIGKQIMLLIGAILNLGTFTANLWNPRIISGPTPKRSTAPKK